MTEGASAAVDVDLVAGDAHVLHEGHRDHSEGFVDFPEVYVLHAPADVFEEFLCRGNWRGGEQSGRLGVTGVANDLRSDSEALGFCGLFGGENECGRAIGDRGGIGGCDCATLTKGGF